MIVVSARTSKPLPFATTETEPCRHSTFARIERHTAPDNRFQLSALVQCVQAESGTNLEMVRRERLAGIRLGASRSSQFLKGSVADHPAFTALQGQYLAFIRAYTLLHREPPAEVDMQRFFRVTAPTVHGMVLTLAKRGLVERVPGRARSLRVLIPREKLPALEDPSRSEDG